MCGGVRWRVVVFGGAWWCVVVRGGVWSEGQTKKKDRHWRGSWGVLWWGRREGGETEVGEAGVDKCMISGNLAITLLKHGLVHSGVSSRLAPRFSPQVPINRATRLISTVRAAMKPEKTTNLNLHYGALKTLNPTSYTPKP